MFQPWRSNHYGKSYLCFRVFSKTDQDFSWIILTLIPETTTPCRSRIKPTHGLTFWGRAHLSSRYKNEMANIFKNYISFLSLLHAPERTLPRRDWGLSRLQFFTSPLRSALPGRGSVGGGWGQISMVSHFFFTNKCYFFNISFWPAWPDASAIKFLCILKHF